MCVCVYVCVYVCMCVCVYVCMCVCAGVMLQYAFHWETSGASHILHSYQHYSLQWEVICTYIKPYINTECTVSSWYDCTLIYM